MTSRRWGWCEESLDGESVALESCVARAWWVTQWPDRPVPAGWTRDILQGGRMIALTHIWRPMSMEKSEKDLRDRESSILQRDTLQNQRKLSRDEERRERREQRQREAEQDANWPDTDHQGVSPCSPRTATCWPCSNATCACASASTICACPACAASSGRR